jgi:hypothetical protein
MYVCVCVCVCKIVCVYVYQVEMFYLPSSTVYLEALSQLLSNSSVTDIKHQFVRFVVA